MAHYPVADRRSLGILQAIIDAPSSATRDSSLVEICRECHSYAEAHQSNDGFRRILLLAAHPGEGRLTQPTAATQAWGRELLFMPLSGHYPSARSTASLGGYLLLAPGVSTVRYPIPQRTFKYVATVQSVTDETCHNRILLVDPTLIDPEMQDCNPVSLNRNNRASFLH
jgi:hypothetical protein